MSNTVCKLLIILRQSLKRKHFRQGLRLGSTNILNLSSGQDCFHALREKQVLPKLCNDYVKLKKKKEFKTVQQLLTSIGELAYLAAASISSQQE